MPYDIIRCHSAGQLPNLDCYFNVLSGCLPIVVCALLNDAVVGYAAAECNKALHFTEVKQLYVEPKYRSEHIGRKLLARLTEEAGREGGSFLSLIYAQDATDAVTLEKVLLANQWTIETPFSVHCLFNSYIFDPPWIHHQYQFPPFLEEFPWADLCENERRDLLDRLNKGNFPATMSPFQNETQIELVNSLGLRQQDRVVGWMITHRLQPDTINYTALYVEPSLQFIGPGIKLLTDAMIIHKKHPIQWAKFELPLRQVSSMWMRFVKRRLVPYADKVSVMMQATFYAAYHQ